MNSEEKRKVVFEMLNNVSRNGWGDYLDLEQDISLQGLSDYACTLALMSAELSEYLGYRGGFGCGDHGHEAALKAFEKKRKRIRKALGYSYP